MRENGTKPAVAIYGGTRSSQVRLASQLLPRYATQRPLSGRSICLWRGARSGGGDDGKSAMICTSFVLNLERRSDHDLASYHSGNHHGGNLQL